MPVLILNACCKGGKGESLNLTHNMVGHNTESYLKWYFFGGGHNKHAIQP